VHHGIIEDILIFLGIAVVVSPLCHRLRISPALGYLVAGSMVGPVGLGLIADNEGTRGLAELGIVFLLFMIGLELSWERLKVIRHFIFGLGSAQVVILPEGTAIGDGLGQGALQFPGLYVFHQSHAPDLPMRCQHIGILPGKWLASGCKRCAALHAHQKLFDFDQSHDAFHHASVVAQIHHDMGRVDGVVVQVRGQYAAVTAQTRQPA